MCSLIYVAPRSQFTIMVTGFTILRVMVQKHMRVAVLSDIPASVIRLQDPSITTLKEACHVAEVALAYPRSLIYDDDTNVKDYDPPQTSWGEEIRIHSQFNSHRN